MSGVVSGAGPLIALGKLNLLHLLRDLYHNVHIPKSVRQTPWMLRDFKRRGVQGRGSAVMMPVMPVISVK